MNFHINSKLVFIDSFQSLSSSLDSLVKNSSKDDFKYLSQEFDTNVLNLVKQNLYYPYGCMSDFEKFKEELPSKEKFCNLLTSKNNSDKEYEHGIKIWNKLEMKTMKDHYKFYLKCLCFIVS